MFKSFLLLIFLFPLNTHGKTKFSKKEIVFPSGKTKIKEFLQLLNKGNNRQTVGIDNGHVTYKDISAEGSTIFSVGRNSYMLYWADFNNDGKKEYSIIYLNSGSKKYSGVLGSFSLHSEKLQSMNFDKIVIKNLFPGKDMSRFHSYLAKTFAIHLNGKTYLRFIDNPKSRTIYSYEWNKDQFMQREL